MPQAAAGDADLHAASRKEGFGSREQAIWIISEGGRWISRRLLEDSAASPAFLMVDKVVKLMGTRYRVKNISINDRGFQGHFPGHPIMPGVRNWRRSRKSPHSHAQTSENFGGWPTSWPPTVKWRKPVRPGDVLVIDVELTKRAQDREGQRHLLCRFGSRQRSGGYVHVDGPGEPMTNIHQLPSFIQKAANRADCTIGLSVSSCGLSPLARVVACIRTSSSMAHHPGQRERNLPVRLHRSEDQDLKWKGTDRTETRP